MASPNVPKSKIPKMPNSQISRKSRKFNFPISLGIFKCPMASPNVPKSKIPNIPNIPNIPKVLKIQFPNILRHIQMSYGISQCPQVQNPEYPEYPENPEYPESLENSISQYP